MDVLLNKKEKPIVDEMLELVKSLTEDEEKALNYMIQGMIQGVRLAKRLEEKKSA